MMWQPSCTLAVLRERAQFLLQIRQFFLARDVLEVDTPLLCRGVATDPFLQAFRIQDRFLQTSPEFAMKRLVAAGSGPIYYLGKAFRKAEVGARHNPEFTMLEWYRPDWTQAQLISEVDALFQELLHTPPAEITTYQALFEQVFDLNPHTASVEALQRVAGNSPQLDKDGYLDFLLTHHIEKNLGKTCPQVIIGYPQSQASLAKIENGVAQRFEFYYQGVELANGYHELTCAKEQRQRFEVDLQQRQQFNQELLPVDETLLAALPFLPPCSGVAVGVDRLLMLKLQEKDISNVLPFAWERA